MKKFWLCFISTLVLIIFASYINYCYYAKNINNFVGSMVDIITEKYPEVDEKEIIDLLNSEKITNNNVLKKYGFVDSDISYLKSVKKTFNKNLIINTTIFVLFGIILFVVSYNKKKKQDDEINNLTNYLKRINEGIYDLEILDNTEGDLSILKNEIYTTTISLKKIYEHEYDERIKIKDNLANISHQLKTPLTAIMLMIDTLIIEDVDEVKRIEYLKDIRSQIENINFLIIALLKLSRFDANVVVFEKNKIIVKNLIMDVLKNVDILRELNGVSIHTKGKSDVSFIGDYKWECEAITNIVKNAIEYAKDEKNVYIIYEDKKVYNEIKIINDGTITYEDKENIFKRFYKKNNNDNNFGIGLSLAKEIIEKDKGTIRVECKNNKTIFILKYYK
ncbi:integral membrane sensor signal transduction histidine kinase [Clostridium sp. CAG:609]|nr:integral membrane sensor signal transduction histidine kinase [Clostridium sp. CAG:609]